MGASRRRGAVGLVVALLSGTAATAQVQDAPFGWPVRSIVGAGLALERADVVVIGEARWSGTTLGKYTTVPLAVSEVLKGEVPPGPFQFALRNRYPNQPVAMPVATWYGVYYLRRTPDGLAPLCQEVVLLLRPGRPHEAAEPADPVEHLRRELLYTAAGPPGDLRTGALRELGWVPADPRTVKALEAALAGDDLVEQGAALESLLRLNQPQALPHLGPWLAQGAKHEGEGLLRYSVLSALGSFHTTADITPVLALASHPDVDVRRMAVLSIREMARYETIPLLAHALDDPDLEVRYHGVMGLAMSTMSGVGPQYKDYQADEARYLKFWHDWWEREGKPAFADAPAAGPGGEPR